MTSWAAGAGRPRVPIPTGYGLYPGLDGRSTFYNPPPWRLYQVVQDLGRTGTLPGSLTSADWAAFRADLKYWRASVVVI